MSVRTFYDELAPLYHLIYEDWETSLGRQGAALGALIGECWGADARAVLDASLGIGTQALGLLGRGFRVTGLDLSVGAVTRARREAALRGLPLVSLVADFRALPVRSAAFDVVLACDNSLPHLDSEADIRGALAECFRCVRPGGGCLLSMRDYKSPPPTGTVEVRPYGERLWAGRRYHLRQVWTWRGPRYDLSFEITPADRAEAGTTVLKTTYLAIPVEQVAGLMRTVGFENVRRMDGRFFQPVLVGTRPRSYPKSEARKETHAMSQVGVRYMIDDVPAAIKFYTTLLGFTVEHDASPAFAAVTRDGVRLLLSGEGSSGKRPLSDGRRQVPGGWNRIHLTVTNLEAEVKRLRGAGVSFRTSEIVSGPGGAQVIVDDPSGNPIEIFQARG